MSEHGVNSLADQRYYHFVVFKVFGQIQLEDCWKLIGDALIPVRGIGLSDSLMVVEHRKIRSKNVFARGQIAEALSQNGRGTPPFLYDVVALRLDVSGERYIALGFPFAGLGVAIVQDLIDAFGETKQVEMVGFKLREFIEISENGLAGFHNTHTRVVGVEFVVTDDKSLTSIRLGGDDPLSSEIYIDSLRQRVKSKFILPSKCALACLRELEEKSGDIASSRIQRSRVMLTRNGHLKFYCQTGLNNIGLLPYLLGQLREADCFSRVFRNPLVGVGFDETE